MLHIFLHSVDTFAHFLGFVNSDSISGISSGTLSDKYSGNLSGTSSGILPDTCSIWLRSGGGPCEPLLPVKSYPFMALAKERHEKRGPWILVQEHDRTVFSQIVIKSL